MGRGSYSSSYRDPYVSTLTEIWFILNTPPRLGNTVEGDVKILYKKSPMKSLGEICIHHIKRKARDPVGNAKTEGC